MDSASRKVLKKKFINYLIPSVCAMWVFSLYTIVDGIFVGRYVGANALAAVNISMPFINFIFALSILFSIGASTIISIYLGEKKHKKANSIFTLGFVILLILAALIFLIIYFNTEKLAVFLGADTSTIGYVVKYLKTIVFFNGCFMIAYYLEVLCKTDGSPYLSIIGVASAAVTNILLDYIFVAKLHMGVEGAAFATGLSQLLSGLIFLSYFLSKRSNLKLETFKIDFKELKRIILIGFPDSITELATGIVILLFNKFILKNIGEDGLIAYSIISYVNSLVITSMVGITQGMQPLISFYYGQKSFKSIKYIFKLTIISIASMGILAFSISMLFTSDIVSLFLDKSASIYLNNLSITALRIYSICFLLLGFNIVISGFFAAIEKPFYATLISLSRGLVIVVAVLFLFTTLFGSTGIWITTTISESLCLIISILALKKIYKETNLLEKKIA
ncbi:MATE family efflux transporter [uncultured Clostridium sp.]|jgi:putative MATE family efflux protein|uniref:MATE family efflux transporter n=1 Tax=uncultured Clostridium sp. TaxID=59620 RepID=UPI00260D4054|nr:MATE family efflux transporter [uncultured Clostridium sp.]